MRSHSKVIKIKDIETRPFQRSAKTDWEGARPFGGASIKMSTEHLNFTNAAMEK